MLAKCQLIPHLGAEWAEHGAFERTCWAGGGYLYSSSSAAWPEIELKPGKRDYLIAKIPMNEYLIKNAPQGILVIVWSWGSQEITKRVKIR